MQCQHHPLMPATVESYVTDTHQMKMRKLQRVQGAVFASGWHSLCASEMACIRANMHGEYRKPAQYMRGPERTERVCSRAVLSSLSTSASALTYSPSAASVVATWPPSKARMTASGSPRRLRARK